MSDAAKNAAVATAREFAATVIAPNAEHWERLGRVPYDTFERAGEAGLCGLMVPVARGGGGLGVGGMAAVMETLSAVCMNTAFALVVHNNLAAFIAGFGRPAQIERYLEDMVRGRKVGAFLLTEPNAGSDAQAIETLAVRDGDGWRLSGDKAWISNATSADVLSVYAQTEPGSGARGIAAFLVDADADGVRRADGYDLMRGHALGTGAFHFDACRVTDEQMILAPGAAFRGAMAGINTARINVAAMCCGMLRESLRIAVDYADGRQAFGRSTLEFQGLNWLLAEVATNLEAAAALTRNAIACAERGDDPTLAAAHAKKFATRVAFDGVAECMQAMGAAGYATSYPLARHLAAAKMAQFLDGTTQIQNIVIARALKTHYTKS
jgi:alkylation response protein AidB-like acyl-CoA dehydrogenase